MRDVALIPAFINPKSGNAGKAREALASSGRFDIREVLPSLLAGEIRKALEAGPERILIAGGDGSICTAAGIVCGTGIELAILPAGTLNHFAVDHGIPLDLATAANVALGATTTRADVGFAGERIFLNTSSIGAYVAFVRLRDRMERYFGYGLASVIAMIRIFLIMPTIAAQVQVNGVLQTFRTPLVFISVGERELKVPNLGKRINGGKNGLHVFVVRGRRRARLLAVALVAVARGVDFRTPEIEAFLTDHSTIDRKRRGVRVSFDGEIERKTLPLEYRLERDALCIVVPQPSSEEGEPPAPASTA